MKIFKIPYSTNYILFSMLFAAILVVVSCSDDQITSLEEAQKLEEIEIITRDSPDCCAQISGPSSFCTDSPNSPIYCVTTCCDNPIITWSGHPSINGLSSRCIDASGVTGSDAVISVEVKCPYEDSDLPPIIGGNGDENFCIETDSKSVFICSEPPYTPSNPPIEFASICFAGEACFDMSSTGCLSNINIIDHHPGLVVSAVGTELCIKAKFCSVEDPFVGYVILQTENPCGLGEIQNWNNIAVGGSGCPACPIGPGEVDCALEDCDCRSDSDCPVWMECVDGVCRDMGL